jgi:hypothetical protein
LVEVLSKISVVDPFTVRFIDIFSLVPKLVNLSSIRGFKFILRGPRQKNTASIRNSQILLIDQQVMNRIYGFVEFRLDFLLTETLDNN